MINIVVPMAGAGSRFSLAGFKDPKPFIDVMGKPMIQWVIENLSTDIEHRFIFICQSKHQHEYGFETRLKSILSNFEIIAIDGLTQGAAETVLFASELIDNNDPLLIANSDQYIEYDLKDFLSSTSDKNVDGSILTMTSDSPKWSYIKFNDSYHVVEVREKEVISSEATVGIYAFSRGKDFVSAANLMIQKDLRVNGEFYIAPVYNELIHQGKIVTFQNIGTDSNQMNGLGTPEDLELFIQKSLK
jgi:NDP-sugar pyrophosphorylase family protein